MQRDDLAVGLYLLAVALLFFRAPEIGPLKLADLALLASFATYLHQTDFRVRIPLRFLVLTVGFVAAAGLSTVLSPVGVSTSGILEFARYAFCLFLFIMTFDYVGRRISFPQVRRIVVLAAVASSTIAALGFSLYMTGYRPNWVVGMMHRPNDPRTMPFYYDPNHYASILVIGYAFLYAELYDAIDRHQLRPILASAAAIMLVGVAVVTTGSRAGLGALAGVTGLLLALKFYQLRGPRSVVGLATAGCLGAVTLGIVNTQLVELFSLSFRSGTITEALSLRLSLWRAAVVTWEHYPLVGVGPNNFVRYLPQLPDALIPRKLGFPHNTYLGLLAENGLIGAGFAFALIGASVSNSVRQTITEPDNQQIAAVSALVALLVIAVFLDVFDSRRLWFVFGLVLALSVKPRTGTAG